MQCNNVSVYLTLLSFGTLLLSDCYANNRCRSHAPLYSCFLGCIILVESCSSESEGIIHAYNLNVPWN